MGRGDFAPSQSDPHQSRLSEIAAVIPSAVFDPPQNLYTLLTEFTVNGEPARKSNSRRLVTNTRTGKPMVIKSAKAMEYGESFLLQVPISARRMWGGSNEHMALWGEIYYASHRPDLSVELILDLLEEAKVISNDRWIKAHFLFGGVDRFNPRAHLRIYRIR